MALLVFSTLEFNGPNLSLYIVTLCMLSTRVYSFGCLIAIENRIQNQSSVTQPILAPVLFTPESEGLLASGQNCKATIFFKGLGSNTGLAKEEQTVN